MPVTQQKSISRLHPSWSDHAVVVLSEQTFDKVLIEVSKANECTNIVQILWLLPFFHCSYLGWVHDNSSFGYDQPKILNLSLLKLALLWLQVEIVIA
jgi:hypothetical protein